jgi:hypothetical protein
METYTPFKFYLIGSCTTVELLRLTYSPFRGTFHPTALKCVLSLATARQHEGHGSQQRWHAGKVPSRRHHLSVVNAHHPTSLSLPLSRRYIHLHCTQCSNNRPICRLIVNRWVSDAITAYRSDLSPRPIYQCDSRYFGQNILNFATYRDLIDDLSVRETIFGPIVLCSLCPFLIDAFYCCPSSLLVSIKT